jgi:hypothetical protein
MKQRVLTAAERSREWRERQARRAVLAHVELGPEFVDALKRRGMVPADAQQPDRATLGRFAGAIIETWAQRPSLEQS